MRFILILRFALKSIDLIMEKSDQELIDIADRMLANLEKQYWETQEQNINFDKECPENNENMHEDYQLLEGDDDNNELNDSESDEEEKHNENEENKQKQEEGEGKAPQQGVAHPPKQSNEDHHQKQLDVGELIEVFPMPEWIPEQKEVNINSQKIKQFTLKMNLPIPDWVNNEETLKNRITELFGKKQ